MNFSDDTGIKIDEEIKVLIRKAVEIAGSQNQLHICCGISQSSINNWLGGDGNVRIGQYIMWEQWRLLRRYLIAHSLIDPSDPKWMLPSEMRARIYELQRLLEEAKKHAAECPEAIVTAEQFRAKLIQDTLASGLPQEEVGKFITLISECGR